MTVAGEIRQSQPAPAGPALQVRGLSVRYSGPSGEIVALNGVNLSLEAGEVLGLAGPNGCGKTSLIRAVTNTIKPAGGAITVCGENSARLSQRELALKVAVVPQDPQLPEGFTALEVVLMGRTPHLRLLQDEGPADREAAHMAMAMTDTLALAERRVGQLSGGERQRVVIARALTQETAVLLLDEPTAHLDISHQASALGLMRTLCREQGKGVLAVVHDLTLAAQYCDRLVMLKANGVLAAQGTPADVLRPDLISAVYGVEVEVMTHPRTGRPVVAPSAPAG